MFSHVMLGSNDIERSKRFYDALFAVTGGPGGTIDPRGRLVYSHLGQRFMLSKPIDGQPACGANGGTIGFTMDSAEQAQAWHGAGVANGGSAIEEPPGERPSVAGGVIYLAYLRDPDGNKLCALCRPGA